MMSDHQNISEEMTEQLLSAGIPEHLLDFFDGLSLGELTPKLGIQFVELSAECAVATMPVEGNTQPAGLLHGGASAALLETLGSFAASVAAGKDKIAVGTELNISHVRSASSGVVTGTAHAVKLGRTQCIHTVEITDQDGKLISTGRMTNTIIPRSLTSEKKN